MKTMTCRQLGGACDTEFKAETFDEIAKKCKEHGMEMYQKGDQLHIDAMDQMQMLMNDPSAMQMWLEARQKEFEALPEDK